MSAAIAKFSVRTARQRAAQIRQGIHDYLDTLALIQKAWNERDWETLGYGSWDQYVETEFSDARLRLPAEHRQKAVTELRLSGMSTRAIGSAIGTSEATVRRDLAGASDDAPALPETATGRDGKSYATTQPMRQAKGQTDKPPPAAPEPDQPEAMPAEAPPLGLDDGVSAPSSEASGTASPAANGVPDGQTPTFGPSGTPGSVRPPQADPGNGAARVDRGFVGDLADARNHARNGPAYLAQKAIEAMKLAREIVRDRCGGVQPILDDLRDDPTGYEIAPLWVAELDETVAFIEAWRTSLTSLRRERLRSVK